VLAAQGKAFCAGANFGDGSLLDREGARPGERAPAWRRSMLEGNRCFAPKSRSSPAFHGAAVGGGLGLAMVADFRVTCPEARFCANFTGSAFIRDLG
jgi:enoyl-CoA hydratase/carnithine racemase